DRDSVACGMRAFGATNDEHGLPSANVRALCEDRHGIVWIGTYVGGLSSYDPRTDTFRHYLFVEGDDRTPNSKSVTDILEDSSGRLWVGTYSSGLDLLDRETGRFRYFTVRDGLAGNKVDGILEDADGDLWITTNQGLSRFDPDRETFHDYDVRDGLQGDQFHVGSRTSTLDGELVFGGSNGYNRFLPENLTVNPLPPPIAITGFRLFDREVPLRGLRGEQGEIRLRPGADFFSFEFTALDFGNPEKNQYAYRLVGFDDDWIYSGARRYAAYTNLDPGRYVFRVKASNSDGIWNESGIAVPLRILPPFYRTWWFYLLAAVALGSSVWGTHRIRVAQQVRHSLAMERVRVAERELIREQISRDYHDALGHKITKISLFSALVQRQLGSADHPAVPYLQKVIDATQDLSRETRGFVWMLNPSKDRLYEVAAHLHEFGANLFEDTNVQVEVRGLDESLRSVRVPVEWKREISLLFREAFHNSLKHAECRNVRLEFDLRLAPAATLSIELLDDGRGIGENGHAGNGRTGGNGTPPVRNGNGLENMQRRAETAGGTLEIHSAGQGGTSVRFSCAIGPDPQNRGLWRPSVGRVESMES
ncbi:MAG: hypothetical protein KC729_17050, partial [Candidatus Eisenbacteria bacterium]|nr:hypothetical protein [Candidatus Eisenbacteria bacterium]